VIYMYFLKPSPLKILFSLFFGIFLITVIFFGFIIILPYCLNLGDGPSRPGCNLAIPVIKVLFAFSLCSFAYSIILFVKKLLSPRKRKG